MNRDWWYLAARPNQGTRQEIAEWVLNQEWPLHTVLVKPKDYHVTVVYSYDGRAQNGLRSLIEDSKSGWRANIADIASVETFAPPPDRPGAPIPVVLELDGPLGDTIAREQRFYTDSNYRVSTFDKVRPHITVAKLASEVTEWTPPEAPDLFVYLESDLFTGGLS